MKEKIKKIWNAKKLLAVTLLLWNLFDILLHIAVGRVEPLRISGNVAAIIAAIVIGYVNVSSKRKVLTGVVAAVIVMAFNMAWAINLGSLPLIATVLIIGSLAMLARLAYLQKQAG